MTAAWINTAKLLPNNAHGGTQKSGVISDTTTLVFYPLMGSQNEKTLFALAFFNKPNDANAPSKASFVYMS